jgi:outer membrane protein assembly factor BamB
MRRDWIASGLALICTATAAAQWPQWGGPSRDFKADDKPLAAAWPESGPKKLWSRQIGDGFSAVVLDAGVLYTMARRGQGAEGKEAVVALKAEDGSPLWEHVYDAPFSSDMLMEFGPGPHSTPLVVGGKVFSVGVTGKLHALDAKTGKPVWSLDLKKEFQGKQLDRGYSSSPIAYKDTIILPVGGGDGRALMAFAQSDGRIVWGNQNFEVSHSSPILMPLGGVDHLVCFMAGDVAGVNPNDGELLWKHEFKTQYSANICTPVQTGPDTLFLSAAYGSGSRGLQIVPAGGKFEARELWYKANLQIHHANAIHRDGFVYGSSGSFGPATVFCANAATGETLWKKSGIAKATCVFGDGKLILLDQDGLLVLASATPQEFKELSRCQLLQKVAWTVPTLAGGRLYVRDRSVLMALGVAGG